MGSQGLGHPTPPLEKLMTQKEFESLPARLPPVSGTHGAPAVGTIHTGLTAWPIRSSLHGQAAQGRERRPRASASGVDTPSAPDPAGLQGSGDRRESGAGQSWHHLSTGACGIPHTHTLRALLSSLRHPDSWPGPVHLGLGTPTPIAPQASLCPVLAAMARQAALPSLARPTEALLRGPSQLCPLHPACVLCLGQRGGAGFPSLWDP